MTERRGTHREIPEQESQKKNYASFVESLNIGPGEKVLRLADDGSTDSWNVDTMENDMVYLSRSVSNKEEPERAMMKLEELAREQYTLETSQKLLESWPKIVEKALENTHLPEERKNMLARLESVKNDSLEGAALNIVLKEIDPDSETARNLLLDTVAAEIQKDVADLIQGEARAEEIVKKAKQPKVTKRGAISGLAFGKAKEQTIRSEEVTESLPEDPSIEKTTDISIDEPEKPALDLETRLSQKDAAFADFVTKANIRSRKFHDRSLPQHEWDIFTNEAQESIKEYLKIAGDNPSIADEERLSVMRSHLEALKERKLMAIAEVEYTPDADEVLETLAPVEAKDDDLMWSTLENDMHMVENEIASRQAAGKPFSAETLKKDRELLKRDLDLYTKTALKEPNPVAEKNIDRAIAFLATLDILARKAELTEEQSIAEEQDTDLDATPVMAPNREASEPSSKNNAKNTNVNAGSSLMSEAIKSGYKPKPPGQALMDWIKNIFS
ncbi:hypothetical protein KBC55_04100 [Patescibacteria group bacterium]|nr:hypothetical protein [Patescibacteria group bacterium]